MLWVILSPFHRIYQKNSFTSNSLRFKTVEKKIKKLCNQCFFLRDHFFDLKDVFFFVILMKILENTRKA